MLMPNRHGSDMPAGEDYKYGMGGMEKDNEISGNGNSYTTSFRQYDPRIARWTSIDPLFANFPWQSPYVAFDNNPIYFNDPLGLAAGGPGDDEVDLSGGGTKVDLGGASSSWSSPTTSSSQPTSSDNPLAIKINEKTEAVDPVASITINVGTYLVYFMKELPMAPDDYNSPATFASYGVKPTYDAARKYANCWGNCYSTSASRINKAYEDLYGVTPIDYSQNSNGTFTSADYRTASSQRRASNFGYGVGGALANGGEATLVDNAGVWNGDLTPGAALQIWHSTDTENLTSGGGHSQIFVNYSYGENGVINGLNVFDNSGVIENLRRSDYENYETIKAGNLLAP